MPELAEVEFFRKQWDPGLGRRITEVRLHAHKRIFRGSDPRRIVQHLTGRRFSHSYARGKQMLFQFSGGNWIGIHLGMTGKLRTEAATFRPGKHDHLVLQQSHQALVLSDSRLFGRVRFHHGKNFPDWWLAGGPDILSDAFNDTFIIAFLKRHSRAPIKAVLLMQTGFPGVGNWMADEILWRARIAPARLAGRLTSSERINIVRQTKFVARESMRTLAVDFTDPPAGWLIHQKWKRDGICPLHRTPLARSMIGGRSTVWCPCCQNSR
jgi:formamidopyrimidine-DNA glycosylase